MNIKTCLTIAILFVCVVILNAQPKTRERISLDDDWRFAFGDASSMELDYKHGIDYFSYFAKAQALDRSEGPINTKFNDSTWQLVDVPHDWVVDLPFCPEASYSHGFKTVGYKYPKTSVGWYRKHFQIDETDENKHIYVQFDGIFRDAQVFCNGFYLGHEQSGYATQIYDVTEYLNFGGDNTLVVRVDASMEEGWYYEGAGIYRHVWLNKVSPLHVSPFGTYVTCNLSDDYKLADIQVNTEIENSALFAQKYTIKHRLLDKNGTEVAKTVEEVSGTLSSKAKANHTQSLTLQMPTLWDVENPYLYTLETMVMGDGFDRYETKIGLRSICFDAQKGFLLNGKNVKLKGTNLHQDHAGVGVGMPDALIEYRVKCLKEMGSNAIRCSHNPATPELLDICDREGIFVLDENRLMGINKEHIDLMERMIKRDRNHPCIILWSIGNEEWALEGNETGKRVARSMTEYVHRMDSTRLTTAGISGGRVLLYGLDVKGYNYIIQNDVDGFHCKYPDWKAVGTEETSGCGTRGIYETDKTKGWLNAHNRVGTRDSVFNVIERGWKFYAERPWLGGLFYWTGFDYRGEPSPLDYPSTGSQFGILDYCGFPKDEAFYLKSWWTNEPILHIFPHWNLAGKEGQQVSVWAYSNCDEVELFVNSKSLGRKSMPKNGHLEWNAIYQPGKLVAQGYKNGKKTISQKIETTGKATQAILTVQKNEIIADNRDLAIVNIQLKDKKGRVVPDAMNKLKISVEGPAKIIGVGNGNPGYLAGERPLCNKKQYEVEAFCGLAQVLVQSDGIQGEIYITVDGDEIAKTQLLVNAR